MAQAAAMATRFDWGGESTPQRNEPAKESASNFEASPDALDRFFSDAVRAFPSPSRPPTEERPTLRALPRTSGSSAETASVRDGSDESLEAPGHPLLRAEDVSARFGTAVVEEPSQTAVERPPSVRAVREPRQKPTAPVSRRRRVGWGKPQSQPSCSSGSQRSSRSAGAWWRGHPQQTRAL